MLWNQWRRRGSPLRHVDISYYSSHRVYTDEHRIVRRCIRAPLSARIERVAWDIRADLLLTGCVRMPRLHQSGSRKDFERIEEVGSGMRIGVCKDACRTRTVKRTWDRACLINAGRYAGSHG